MFETDYVVRQVRLLLEQIAKAINLPGHADHAQAEEDLNDAYRALLPIERGLFETLSARSLLPMLREPERLAAIAALQTLEGELRLAQGNPKRARRCFQRALTFLEHAATQVAIDPELLARVHNGLHTTSTRPA